MAAGGLTGILLVGGASRRFGSPKALAELDGETLAERAWRTLGRIADERIAVGKLADRLALPFPLLDDDSDVRAPLAGVIAGLGAASYDRALVLPVDTPLVSAAELRRLADAGGDVAVPSTGPLPGAYSRSALPQLEASLREGRLALRDAIAPLVVRIVEVDPAALVNVNTPAELDALRLSIVPLRAEHALGFRRLVAETLQEFGFRADPDLDHDLADPAAYYEGAWVVLMDGVVLGSVALRRLASDQVELKRMYLRPVLRGHGVGRRLMEIVLLWAREHGIRRIALDTTEEMAAARRLYEANGFVRIPGDAPRQGKQRLLYELRL